MDYIEKTLTQLAKEYLPAELTTSTYFPKVINECAEFLKNNPIWETEYFDEASYYASKMKVNHHEIWQSEDCFDLIVELGLPEHENECKMRRIIEILPSLISYFKEEDQSDEQKVINELRGGSVNFLCDHNDKELLIEWKECVINNPKIMIEDDWNKIYDFIHDQESDLVMDETSNQYYNTAANILVGIQEELQEYIDNEESASVE